MDIITLSLAKKYANKVAAGFKNVELDGMNLTFTLLDDTKATVTIPAPADGKDGISVQGLSIDNDGSLLCHMSDGSVIDAGYVPTVDPDLTNYYTKEEIDDLNNVMFIPIITHGTTGDLDPVNIEAAQKALSYIGKKDVIFRMIEKDTVSSESMKYRLYFLSPAEYANIEDISTYTGTITWNASKDKSLILLNDLYYISDTTLNIDVFVENGKVTRLSGTSGNGSRYTATTTELALLSKTNTKKYTPTGDYHPATKKYVDDTIAAIEIPEIDLSNYYTKSEADSAISTAVTDAIADIQATDFSVVTERPTENISTNTIYLISKETTEGENIYEEYIYVNNNWEKIGETTIDLSQYSTTEEMNAAIAAEVAKINLSNYLTITEASNTYATKTEISNINSSIDNMYSKTEVNTAIETAINNIEYPTTDLSNYYTKTEIDTIIGDINSILDNINGEEV